MQQRSTKGASKQRRELINGEIIRIRDLLPTSSTVRSHLSQLQVMSLCNAYISKCNFFENTICARNSSFLQDVNSIFDSQLHEVSELLPGFLMMVSVEGKILYLSENVLEHLGHSMIDILTHVDTVYDLVESKDHKMLKDTLSGVKSGVHFQDEWSFVCRMGLTKKSHQNLGLSDQKLMQVRGYFVAPRFSPDCQHPVFVAMCTPRLKSSLASDANILRDTMVFESLHQMDMKFLDISHNGELNLGYSRDEIQLKSWYEIIHPDDIHRATAIHKNIIYSESESWSPLFVRVQTKYGQFVWMCIMMSKIKIPNSDSKEAVVCINQVVREHDILHECESGLFRSSYEYSGISALKDNEFTGSSGTDSDGPVTKCSGREELMRRLRRKLTKPTGSSGSKSSCGATPSPRLGEKSPAFSFDAVAISNQNCHETSSNGYYPYDAKRSRSDAQYPNQFDYDSSPRSQRYDSCSSTGSVFQSASPFSSVPLGNCQLSPNPFGLAVSCSHDDGNEFVTSMPSPTPRKDSISSDIESFGLSSQEDDDIVNIVEEMIEGRALHDDTAKPGEIVKKKPSFELPELCPGTVADFFREFDGSFGGRHALLAETREVSSRSFSHFGAIGALSAGQANAGPIGMEWSSKSLSERAWPNFVRHDLSTSLQHDMANLSRQVVESAFLDMPYGEMISATDMWGGFSHLMMVEEL